MFVSGHQRDKLLCFMNAVFVAGQQGISDHVITNDVTPGCQSASRQSAFTFPLHMIRSAFRPT